MNFLAFIASLVESVAWPIAVVLVIIIFSKKIPELARFVERVKHKDTEIIFRDIENTKSEIERKLENPDVMKKMEEHNVKTEKIADKLFALAKSHPPTAILEGWKLIESSIEEIYYTIFAKRDSELSTIQKAEKISKESNLNEALLRLIINLFELRNRVAHGNEIITEANAYIVVESVLTLHDYLAGFLEGSKAK
jgi:hypothetical protein